MTALDRLHQAEAAAREAEDARQDAYKAAYKSGDKAEIAAANARCANTQANLLAALDAARGEAVAWADDDEIKRSRHYGGSFNAWLTKYPGKDTPLYAAPPAALADAFAIAHKAAKMTADACKSATGRHGTINQFVNLVQIAHDASAQAQQPAALAANKENNNG